MTEMIEKYRPLLYRVSTLYVEGTGFWLPDYSFLVCNEHVVRDQKQVVVKTAGQERQLAHVQKNKVRASYNKAQFLEGRRELMSAYPTMLESL